MKHAHDGIVAARFSRFVLARRTQMQLTQEAFARHCELSPTSICQYESGKRVPTLASAIRIAEASGASIEELITAVSA